MDWDQAILNKDYIEYSDHALQRMFERDIDKQVLLSEKTAMRQGHTSIHENGRDYC